MVLESSSQFEECRMGVYPVSFIGKLHEAVTLNSDAFMFLACRSSGWFKTSRIMPSIVRGRLCVVLFLGMSAQQVH